MSDRELPLLSVKNLKVQFPTPRGLATAVNGVSFDLARRERLGIVGESGSGKSVLSRTIMGLTSSRDAKISGQVMFNGREILGLRAGERRSLWGREIAMVFQDPLSSLHPIIPVGDQVTEAVRRAPGVSRREARAKATELLDMVGIPDAAAKSRSRAHELSGGQCQRVMIAMAMACTPKLLLADEPTTALDVTVQAKILELFDELCAEFSIGLIMVSHDLGVIGRHTDRVTVMYAGKMVETGSITDVFEAPTMQYTRALIRAIPRFDANHRGLPEPISGLPPNLLAPPPGCSFAPRCRAAIDVCHESAPELVPACNSPEHRYACWQPTLPVSASTPGKLVGTQ
ncbi:ABC transporter ATP-binding protein [Rhodococcus sp. OK302]|uniref:ABC transporter ATP-binding protein n=1 Tax=Rhodococcus sp. OK302 TaxID=1882769 RepID=UPI000B93E5BD|nr:ABC transporter ATP-binding protein [Rhodococcus sp. OK302]OYD61124.1 peptide/nickel transport system ATP-binding protein/oligopeptide transport system ATP-binding protein [Rhodococcus sp. OK302]